MIFSELYSTYYNTVAKIIDEAVKGELCEEKLYKIIDENAFSESVLTIIPSLMQGKWQLLNSDYSTPLKHSPTMPLTALQKQWFVAILNDPKVKLFYDDIPLKDCLANIEPLFTNIDYKLYDQYSDGDNYSDPRYIKNFRLILEAIKKKRPISITAYNKNGRVFKTKLLPHKLEYSSKDDKFRVISLGRSMNEINLQRIIHAQYTDIDIPSKARLKKPALCEVVISISDELNALERALIHFAHFEKRVEKIGDKKYVLRIKYYENDETELVTRILSFGPYLKVTEPENFVNLIKNRLILQKNCKIR